MRAYPNLEQRTPEWHALRAGRVGSSDAKAVTGKLKSGGEPAARRDLRTRVALSTFGVTVAENSYTNADMARGISAEKLIISQVEVLRGEPITEMGYIAHDDLPVGASPDGLIGSGPGSGIIEAKAPRSAIQIALWSRADDRDSGLGAVPARHHQQLLHLLFVTERDWVTYASFCEDMVPELQLYLTTIHRTQVTEELETYEAQLRAFCDEVESEVKMIQTLIDIEKG
tara:strand:+ start:766 stop:1449 length:684 start_codon:yes stop_codon:yes gene_type:complete